VPRVGAGPAPGRHQGLAIHVPRCQRFAIGSSSSRSWIVHPAPSPTCLTPPRAWTALRWYRGGRALPLRHPRYFAHRQGRSLRRRSCRMCPPLA
jgi:hypothetical protein